MELIIEIPNSIYANLPKIVNGSIASKRILDCVKNGTPLPKGHGRLIDADAVYDDFEKGEYDFEESLEFAPTIIPADTEGEDKE